MQKEIVNWRHNLQTGGKKKPLLVIHLAEG